MCCTFVWLVKIKNTLPFSNSECIETREYSFPWSLHAFEAASKFKVVSCTILQHLLSMNIKRERKLEKHKLFIRNNMELSLKISTILTERFYPYKF